ncbi:MAG: SpoIIE family protein phosphatase [Thermoanaerobaculaceae bacterium]|jgi:serine phosphatase RsbU (regulator of sigma subunit)|nr:SpoIIE family protein phosphatase [Thermoanaerobaculaceae bacterium]
MALDLGLHQHRDPHLRYRFIRLGVITGTVVLVALLAGRVLGEGTLSTLSQVVLWVWLSVMTLVGLGWLWRRLTYRVGVRLFLSYLIVGVLPFLLLASLGAVLALMAAGQYASVRFGSLLDRTYESLTTLATQAASLPHREATDLLSRAHAVPPANSPSLEWVVASGTEVRASPGLKGVGPPDTRLFRDWSGPLLLGGKPYLAAARHVGDRLVVALTPLREGAEAAARQAPWFAVGFSDALVVDGKGGAHRVTIDARDEGSADTPAVSAPETLQPPPWDREDVQPVPSALSRGLLARRLVMWPRISKVPLDWATGEPQPSLRLVVFLRTSLAEAWTDFVRAPYQVAKEAEAAFVAVSIFFAVVYVLVVSLAVVMIVSITRSTARLTRGARAVAGGDLSHRIPVKRRDQLGDLAVAFNAMTEAVGRMLVEVADKERLKREMELAREIQQSLLPTTQLQHAGVSVSAHFSPASEVGGDYFDIFPLAGRKVMVTVGDVAGHGVSTGLLMAMLKSAMGTLVLEGYGGSELLERVNRLLLQQSVKHRMATLAIATVDAGAGLAEVTSCGHPPVLFISPAGGVEELLLSSLPLGTRLPVEPAWRRLAFPPGSTLLLYSDGLTEAANAAGMALGQEGLRQIVQANAGRPAQELVTAVLEGLVAHLAGTPLTDDLTVLVVEHTTVKAPVES